MIRATTPPPSPLLVTPREAARLLAVSERTLWSLAAAGEIPRVRIGRAVRYRVADLRAYVDAPPPNEKGRTRP